MSVRIALAKLAAAAAGGTLLVGGAVHVAEPQAANLEANARYVTCPAALPSYPDMSLVACYETTDVAGRKLNLAWEAGCPSDALAAP